MPEDGDAGQPAVGDKPEAPKAPQTSQAKGPAAPFVSTFINKGATGKKVAPKAVGRRRPAQQAAAKPATPPVDPKPVDSNSVDKAPAETLPIDPKPVENVLPESQPVEAPPVESQPIESSPVESQPVEPQHALPTPSATQDISDQHASHIPQMLPPVAAVPQRVPAAAPPASPRRSGSELNSDRSPKRRRVENIPGDHNPTPLESGPLPTPPDVSTTVQDSGPGRQSPIAPVPETSTGVSDETPASDSTPALQAKPAKKRRKLPWLAGNQPQDGTEGVAAPGTTPGKITKARAIPKPKAKRKAPAAKEPGNGDAAGEQVDPAPEGQTQPAATQGWTPEAPPKKPRKPRKDIGQKRRKAGTQEQEGGTGEGATGEGETNATEAGPAKKKRAPRKKKVTPADGDQEEDGQDHNQPNHRRGRHPRSPTPSDAEDQRIDEQDTFMHSLASRNIRTGKLSERERKMREINWDEVKERRKREAAVSVSTFQERRRQVEESLNALGGGGSGTQEQAPRPRFREVDGEIVMVQEAGAAAQEADVDRELDLLEEVEEVDLTQRITTKSFLRDSKRFPKDFMLPGQGTRWTVEATDAFYSALQVFGTDFMMISTMFPGSTRRSIKLKFNREERDNPDRIKSALHAPRNSNWDDYLAVAGIPESTFVDPRAVERELQEERDKMQVDIDAAKVAAEEERRQRRLAGAELTEEENADNDNAGGRKKRKKRERMARAVAFADEPGVEVLGPEDAEAYGDD